MQAENMLMEMKDMTTNDPLTVPNFSESINEANSTYLNLVEAKTHMIALHKSLLQAQTIMTAEIKSFVDAMNENIQDHISLQDV